jgi:hypothetical protein
MWVPFLEIKKKRKIGRRTINKIQTNLWKFEEPKTWGSFRNHPTLVYKIGCKGESTKVSLHPPMHHERWMICGHESSSNLSFVLIYKWENIWFPFFTIFDCGCNSSMIMSRVLRMTQKFWDFWFVLGDWPLNEAYP